MKKFHETDKAKFSAGELVLKAGENTTSKKIEIVNFREDRAMVASSMIASIDPAWGLAVTTETLHSLLTHSTPGIGTGGKRSSEDYDNARVAEKKRKRDEKQQRDESQMSEQEVAALRRRERLETAERRRKEAQSKKDEKM